MAGVAVVQRQNLLNNDHQTNCYRLFLAAAMKTHPNPGPLGSRTDNCRKKSPQKTSSAVALSKDHDSSDLNTNSKRTTQLVMGQVRILKRGEPLPTAPPKEDDLKNSKTKESDKEVKKKVKYATARPLVDLVLPSSTDRLGPEPEFYAGSSFFTSPPPSSLPVPAFIKKKIIVLTDDSNDAKPQVI